MLKNILKLSGAQQLSKTEQKSINGGKKQCKQSVPYDPQNPPGTGNECKEFGPQCAEADCRFPPLEF